MRFLLPLIVCSFLLAGCPSPLEAVAQDECSLDAEGWELERFSIDKKRAKFVLVNKSGESIPSLIINGDAPAGGKVTENFFEKEERRGIEVEFFEPLDGEFEQSFKLTYDTDDGTSVGSIDCSRTYHRNS